MIKGESEWRWKLANLSLLLRSHYDYKKREKSALWVSAAIWCIHLAARPTWGLSLDGWIYLSHWLGQRWINRLGAGIEMEAIQHGISSHFESNRRTWGQAHQIKSNGKTDLVNFLQKAFFGSDVVTGNGAALLWPGKRMPMGQSRFWDMDQTLKIEPALCSATMVKYFSWCFKNRL